MRTLVTAGPTHEPIDPVRYLANRSSGKMGFAIAAAARAAGHDVTLVAGPVALDTPRGVRRIDVLSAADMFRAVAAEIPQCDCAIMAAAVADFRPLQPAPHKIKKGDADTLTLTLTKTRDILGSARGELGFGGWLVGFAAETRDLHANALAKLRGKGCDMVVANDVSRPGVGFGSDDNEVTLLFADGRPPQHLPRAPKATIAAAIVAACTPQPMPRTPAAPAGDAGHARDAAR